MLTIVTLGYLSLTYILSKRIQRCYLLLIIGICLPYIFTGCMTPHYISSDNDNEIKQISTNIKPFRVGNPLGKDKKLIEKRYFGKSTKWWCAGTGVAVMGVTSIFFPPAAIGIPVVGMLGYGTGRGLEAYYGGPFDYESYRIPDRPELVIFWFAGADEGACAHKDYGSSCDYCRAAREYGYECIAMFNFRDVDKALEYASKLPKGTELIVRGHSMGGSAAVKFVKRLPDHLSVLLLDTRDPTSWFGHEREKPDNVRYWRNVLPGDAQIFTPENKHEYTNYIWNMNAANIFMMLGGPWGICPGALNIVLTNGDHHEVGRY